MLRNVHIRNKIEFNQSVRVRLSDAMRRRAIGRRIADEQKYNGVCAELTSIGVSCRRTGDAFIETRSSIIPLAVSIR